MPRSDRHVLLDGEDERLTAPERNYLRQIAIRLRNLSAVQPKIYDSTEFADELERVFGQLERRSK